MCRLMKMHLQKKLRYFQEESWTQILQVFPKQLVELMARTNLVLFQ